MYCSKICGTMLTDFAAQRVRDALVSERQILIEGLQQISFLQPYPSQANFVLCKVGSPIAAGQLACPGSYQISVSLRHEGVACKRPSAPVSAVSL